MEVDGAETYLQSEASLVHDDRGLLWRLPVEPSLKAPKGLGPLKEAPAGPDSYAKRCYMIAKNWKENSPLAWIPAELLATTPYSLALLDSLAKLSSLTKAQIEACHADLLSSVQARFNKAGRWVTTQVKRPGCEEQIAERTDGLMVADFRSCFSNRQESNRVDKVEKSIAQIADQQAQAVKRVVERRAARQQEQLEMQEELWSSQHPHDRRASRVELVDIEWQQPTFEESGLSRKAYNKARRRARLQAAMRPTRSLRSMKAPNKSRAITMEDLSTKIQKEDENAWLTDSDSDSDHGGVSINEHLMPRPDELEPGKRNRKLKNFRNLGGLDASPPPTTTSRVGSKKGAGEIARNKADHERWRCDVLARSMRLPSERVDLTTFNKLESGAAGERTTSMMDALKAIDVNRQLDAVEEEL